MCRELDKRDREKLEKEKEEKRRKERKNRDAFKALLQQHRAEGLLHAKLRWKVTPHCIFAEHRAALPSPKSAWAQPVRPLRLRCVSQLTSAYGCVLNAAAVLSSIFV